MAATLGLGPPGEGWLTAEERVPGEKVEERTGAGMEEEEPGLGFVGES